jgi:plasmid stability protein
MTNLTTRATVYLEPDLHKALRMKAVETSRSLSDLVNDAIRAELAENAEDLEAFDARKKEPTLAFEEFVKGLRRHGKL